MKKILALVMSLLLFAAFLAACGNGDAVPEQPAADTATTAAAGTSTADTSDTMGAADTTDDSQAETSANDTTAPTKDTTASATADTIADKTTFGTGKSKSTAAVTKQPTVSKTQSTKGDVTKTNHTKNTTTGKTKPTKPPVVIVSGTTTKTATQTTTGKDKIVISGVDTWVTDDTLNIGWVNFGYVLREKMALYKGEDVKYSVIVEVVEVNQDNDLLFWQSTEELAQFHKEYYEVFNAFDQEALRLNPSYHGNPKDIEIWTEEMRKLYERMPELIKQWRIWEQQYDSYLTNALNQRVKELKEIVGTELIPISTNPKYYPFFAKSSDYAFFMELTAEEINTIGERGGYFFIRLTTRD